MQPKLLKSSQLGEFVPAEYNGVNESGYEPVCDRVLVLPDMASEKTSGGIHLTAEQVDRHTMAAETGVIVAVGPDAFKWTSDRSRPWEGYRPKAGDRCYLQRYSGQVMLGEDGKFYRLMEYGCVGAVRRAQAQPTGVGQYDNSDIQDHFRWRASQSVAKGGASND